MQALRRGLLRSEGFALYVAVCNSPADRGRLIAMLSEAMPGVTLHTVSIGAKSIDPLEEALAQLPGEPAGTVMFLGLEKAVPSTVTDHPILQSLNLRREEWPAQLPCPVVFWVPEYVAGLLGRKAPDFFDWRSDTVHFPALTEAGLIRVESAARFGGEDEGMPRPARLERIR